MRTGESVYNEIRALFNRFQDKIFILSFEQDIVLDDIYLSLMVIYSTYLYNAAEKLLGTHPIL